MKFGISTFNTDEGIGPAELGAAVEERGFDSLFLAEHTHIPVSRKSAYPGGGDLPRIYYRTLDPFVSLSAAAVSTKRILLGTGIALIVERDPITTAKEVASLDLISGGRAVLGVGAGWNREEMQNHGTDPRTRGALMNERLQAIRLLWTEEEAEFDGKYVRFERSYAWPKPVQTPHPPIYVGGGEAAFDRITEFGDAWMPTGVSDPDDLAPQMRTLNERAGREVPVTVYASAKNPDTLRRFRDIGVDRALLYLPTRPHDETLSYLDELAGVVRELG